MFNYILLGLVQGVSEFLPVSSSGHLILLKSFLGIEQDIILDITLHLATLLAVVFFYRKKLLSLSLSILSLTLFLLRVQPLKRSNLSLEDSKNLKLVTYLIIGTIPAALIGYFYKDFFESLRSPIIVSIMLLLVALLMLFDYLRKNNSKKPFTYTNVLLIGLAQAFAIIPGTSRSGITITSASLMGIDKKEAADFTFLLSIPVILGAFIFKVTDISNFSYFLNPNIIVSFVVALVSGYLSIGLLINLLKKYGFLPFIIYRIALALIVLLPLYF